MKFLRHKKSDSKFFIGLSKKAKNVLYSKQFTLFFSVGASCALLTLTLMYLLTSLLNIHYLTSTSFTWFSTNFIGFYLNKKYTFKTSGNLFWRELRKYYGVMFSSFLINLALMYFFVSLISMWYLFANVLVIGILFFYNFVMHKRFSFR